MRIAIDTTPLMKAQRTGVARYTLNLVRALSREVTEEEFLLSYRLSRFSRRRHRIAPPTARFRRCWVQGRMHPRGVQVTHGPGGRLLLFRGAKSVVTVHDVFSILSGDFASAGFRRRRAKQYAEIAERADRIICVSTWTRDTFWEHHRDVDDDRFVVIPEGVEDRFSPEAGQRVGALRAKYGIHGPYVLHVGDLAVRKNVPAMIDAYEQMPADGPWLVLAGKLSHGCEGLPGEIARRGLSDRIVWTGYFPDEDLPALYAGAECLLFPSLLEGFGLPVLESMACGTPVVTTDRGALQETTGGIRVRVDPNDPESIRDGVTRLVWDSELRARLVVRGIEWAKLYDWSRVAQLTLKVYREAAR